MSEALPRGWVTVPLRSVGRWAGGGTPSKAEPRYWTNGTIPWVSPKDMKVATLHDAEDHITEEAVRESATRVIEAGSVLIVTRSGILQRILPVAVNAVPVSLNQDMKAITPHDGVDERYLYWMLVWLGDEILRTCTKSGTTVASVEITRLYELPVPLAPLPEQRRIVAALEEHLSALDAAVAGLERARANVHRFIGSVLAAAATGELLDGIALGDWEAVTLQDVVDPTRKCAYGVLQPGPNVEDGVPLVRVGDVNHGVVSARDLKRVSPAVASAYPRTRLRGGELLMTLVGTIGRTAVVPSELAGANVARAIGVIPVGSRARAEWLNIWFRSPAMLSFMNARAHEVARKTLNLEDVRAARVSLPPIDVQDQLVAIVERRTDAARRLMGELDTQLARANGLRRSILRSAFSGCLVPQDPAEAPASIAPERDRTERSSAPASSRPMRGRGRTARAGSRRG